MARVKEYNKKEDPLRSVAAGSFATGSNNAKEGSNKRAERKTDRCMLCKNTHNLDECDKFANFEMPKTESKGSESQLIHLMVMNNFWVLCSILSQRQSWLSL